MPPRLQGPAAGYKMVTVSFAQDAVLAAIATPLPAVDVPAGADALGRVLAEDVVAATPLPPFPASIKV
jgi:molybdopterin biosynthesis enzyme